MHFVICDAEGVIIMRGQSSEMIAPPIEPGQTLQWRTTPHPLATLDGSDPSVLLAEARDRADATVRGEAEAQRARFISPGTGKAMAYQQKAAEADRFLVDEAPAADRYPHVYGEAEAIGITPAAMAEMIVRLRDQWQRASAAIERIERAAILAVQAASSFDELRTAQAADWSAVDDLAQSEISA